MSMYEWIFLCVYMFNVVVAVVVVVVGHLIYLYKRIIVDDSFLKTHLK